VTISLAVRLIALRSSATIKTHDIYVSLNTTTACLVAGAIKMCFCCWVGMRGGQLTAALPPPLLVLCMCPSIPGGDWPSVWIALRAAVGSGLPPGPRAVGAADGQVTGAVPPVAVEKQRRCHDCLVLGCSKATDQ
jgi:hypothetical protein